MDNAICPCRFYSILKGLEMHEENTEKRSPLLDVNDACRQLKLSRPRLYELMNSGELAYAQLGGRRRIRQADLDAYVESRMVGGRG